MGNVCTFFGHRDCPSSIKPKLRKVLINLIENKVVDMFYIGRPGTYDAIVRSVLKDLVSVTPTSIKLLFCSVCLMLSRNGATDR